MKENHKKGTILNESGQVAASPREEVEDLNLPPGTQALIESRLERARNDLREASRADFIAFADAKAKFWQRLSYLLGLGLIIVGVFNYFVSVDRVREMVDEWAATNLVEGPLRQRIDDTLAEKGEAWIADRLDPLEAKTTALDAEIDRISGAAGTQQEMLQIEQQRLSELKEELSRITAEIQAQQAALELEQARLRDQIAVVDLAVSARVGSRDDWERLRKIASSDSPIAKSAQTAQSDVLQYYEADRFKLVGTQIVEDRVYKNRIYYPLEEAILWLSRPDSREREAAANELADLKIRSATGALVRALEKETDLRVVGRITRALEETTGSKFEPLDIDSVQEWWKANSGREEFDFPFSDYQSRSRLFLRNQVGEEVHLIPGILAARAAIPAFEAIIAREPRALGTIAYLACARVIVGDEANAEAALKLAAAAENGRPYWFVPMVHAMLAARRTNREEAVRNLNRSMEIFPGDASLFARQYLYFRSFLEDPELKWPTPQNAPGNSAEVR